MSFPGECYRRYIEELYRGDALVNGTFSLSGIPARLEQIRCPTLAVTFEHDAIVPWQGAAVVLDRIGSPDKQRLHLLGGHVGAVVSKKAAQGLWPALSAFWAQRDLHAEDSLLGQTTPAHEKASAIAHEAPLRKRAGRRGGKTAKREPSSLTPRKRNAG